MSGYFKHLRPLNGLDFSGMTSEEEFKYLFQDILNQVMHGLCFSPYEDGQEPGDQLSQSQVEGRMDIITPYIQWVRSFSCLEGNELIPIAAKHRDINTLVGAWIGTDYDKNEREIDGLIKLARDGYVDIAAVGNEVMYRQDINEEELLDYIKRVKEALPNVTVGYVDAYYEFTLRPRITEACDVILANCYPYWEGCHIKYSLLYMKQMLQQAKNVANGKRVIITETGWPSQGDVYGDAVPSYINAIKYFVNTQLWSKEEDIDIFYFSSFDEPWKTGAEGDVGAHWGLWDKNEILKY